MPELISELKDLGEHQTQIALNVLQPRDLAPLRVGESLWAPAQQLPVIDAAPLQPLAIWPDTVGDAFEEWLDRFAADKPRVRDLLRPLAFAQGAGLPWETLWPALASAIAGRPYGDSDVEWALEAAGALMGYGHDTAETRNSAFADALGPCRHPPRL